MAFDLFVFILPNFSEESILRSSESTIFLRSQMLFGVLIIYLTIFRSVYFTLHNGKNRIEDVHN